MKLKIGAVLLSILMMSMIFSGCGTNKATTEQLKQKDAQIAQLQSELAKIKTEQQPVLNRAMAVVNLLKQKDMAGLAPYIHPAKGVRFSPYASVNLQRDLVFTLKQLPALFSNSQKYDWGIYDGSGEPINLTFNDYYGKFVYDVDFARPHMIGNNRQIGKGNSINNIAEAYPGDVFVEFHFSGFDPKYNGMDWRSLRLVFEEVNGAWYLIGIVHDQWTI